MNFIILQVFCAFFSGIWEAIAISNNIFPFGSPFLALFCLSPLYIALYTCKSYKKSFLILCIQTLTVHVLSSFWLKNFHGFAVFTLGASAFGTMLLGGLCGIPMHILPAAHNERFRFYEDRGFYTNATLHRVLWFCACIVMWEWIKGTGFLAYPWGTLHMAAYRAKVLTQISRITGVWGVTFLFSLGSALLGEALMLLPRLFYAPCRHTLIGAYKRSFLFALTVFALSTVYGLYHYYLPLSPEKHLNAVIVQQNIDPWEGGDSASISISKRLTEEGFETLSQKGQKADLVIWSEGALIGRAFPAARTFYSEFPEEESLVAFIKRMGCPFLIGGNTVSNIYKRKIENSALLFDKNGSYSGYYAKRHLVPFAEKIPLSENPLMRAFMYNVVGMALSLTEGEQWVSFSIPLSSMQGLPTPIEYERPPIANIELSEEGIANPELSKRYYNNPARNPDAFVRFTTPICFEDAFSDVCTPLYNLGSEIFINITNDSWSKTAIAEYQHFIAASYLAMEYGTTLIRCANAGYTVVVLPSGKILRDLPVFTEGVLACRVPIYKRNPTLFSKWGDWFAYLLFALMGLYALYIVLKLHLAQKKFPLPITLTIGTPHTTVQPEQSTKTEEVETSVAKTKATSKRPTVKRATKTKAAPSSVLEEPVQPKKRTKTASATTKAGESSANEATAPKKRTRAKKT